MAGSGSVQNATVNYWSFGGLVIAMLALALTRLLHIAVPPPSSGAPCPPPPFVISLPETPAPAGSVTPPVAATPVVGPPAATAVPIGQLFRADDPPSSRGIILSSAPLMPLVIPVACTVASDERRQQGESCVQLTPPEGRLCVSGAVGGGRLSIEADAPAVALQASRAVVIDATGALQMDMVQGYFRYDDPDLGLMLFCPELSNLETAGPNARRFAAQCTNLGQDGWTVSGQLTDGGTAAPDSIGVTADAPDGRHFALVGPLAAGTIIVRNAPDVPP